MSVVALPGRATETTGSATAVGKCHTLTFFLFSICHFTEHINDTASPPNVKLNELIRHAEVCVEMVRENNEIYAEVSRSGSGLFEPFWIAFEPF